MQQRRKQKREVNLMTLLANEATEDSRKILKKYNQPPATNCADLEIKLAKLYFDTPDKLQLEKELAEIHPHKNWILKRITPKGETEKPKEEVKATEIKVSADSTCTNPYCPVHGNKCVPYLNFDGSPVGQVFKTTDNKESQQVNPITAAMPMLGLIAILGITFYAINKFK